jgi:hypothetical protein
MRSATTKEHKLAALKEEYRIWVLESRVPVALREYD